ncbi:PREDICTED: peroxidase 43 [Erythranthe guttata]|uniref:peroxidase 43 n=1 Tax=Erythranthe guttata TaxID=4155 RepID=UPI00064DC749|nr:PREDICTED: peroxidase 43 [Erythranthe guttata]|eukprot:XP_012829458.1 PREDICTED: peroxidase 43 [Erythranthe guttata]
MGSRSELQVGFYSDKCPFAEATVEAAVVDAAVVNPRVAPILLRLHFHDCFVEGCDGSILITTGVQDAEISASAHQGVMGFDVIAKAKAAIEAQCPGVVSCADIVAIAARDAVALAGGPTYEVETGRRDGRLSSANMAWRMPQFHDSVHTLRLKFFEKGLTEADLVLLSGGAHTIGTTACFFVRDRLYAFMGTNTSDPTISPALLPSLERQCPKDGSPMDRLLLDQVTGERFDVQSLINIKNGLSVLPSDSILYDNNITKSVVDFYSVDKSSFAEDFAVAMIKMGRIDVNTGTEGEIRQVCETVNPSQICPPFTSTGSRLISDHLLLALLFLVLFCFY